MTLVLTINGPETLWMLSDRRLSYPNRPPKDDGRKMMFLDTSDGVAILGYSGLGATALGTEPADWMSAVLRGRNLPLEHSLGVLAEAAKQQLPSHLLRMPASAPAAHTIMIPAFVAGEARIYTIDLALSPNRREFRFRHTRHVVEKPNAGPRRTPWLAYGGSGAPYLIRDRRWSRVLKTLVRANDRERISDLAVADHLAALNFKVHLGTRDQSVGPRWIVAWRHRKDGARRGGGAQAFYTGTQREADGASIPTIANGMDISALIGVIAPHMIRQLQALLAGQPAPRLNQHALNADLATLPDGPDEKLE